MIDPDLKLSIRDIATALARAQQLAEWKALRDSTTTSERRAADRIASELWPEDFEPPRVRRR